MTRIPDHEWQVIWHNTLAEAKPCGRCGTRMKLMLRREIGANAQSVKGTVSIWRCPRCWEETEGEG